MSEVDLKTNESELISARDQVLNDLEAETSALFAYEDAGQSNTLKVEMVENMGISDLLLEFNSGRYLQDDHLERRESRGHFIIYIKVPESFTLKFNRRHFC